MEPPRLRSSLRKTNYSGTGTGSGGRVWSGTGGGSGSGGGTPTNPTPPDSMNSEDSSYVSAKDNSSAHSTVSALRVRFSPVAASVGQDGGRTLIDIPVQGQNQDYTIPLKVSSKYSSYQPVRLQPFILKFKFNYY